MWREQTRRKIFRPFSTSSSIANSNHSPPPPPRYFFDQELAKLIKVEDNKFLFPLSNQWSITTIPNGGFLSALAVKASRSVIHHGHVISLSGHFYNRTIENSEAEVTVEILSTTKSSSTVMTTISQENKKRCSFFLTFSFKKSNKFTYISDFAPALPPVDECINASEKLRAYAGDNLRIAVNFFGSLVSLFLRI
jgi:acyl-CoA thioesterase